MRSVAASLAAVLAIATTILGCGSGDGAEPGASNEATLVLDFQPNAVHAGIYSALGDGLYEDRGLDLEIREPSGSTDAPKLLAAGRADFAILDIHDLGLARERGAQIIGIGALVDRPLAAVIAADRSSVRRPADLAGEGVGVTGLPSDEAVLDSVLRADGLDPDLVDRVTIGFDSVGALSAGRLAAATAFWNAEGVLLRGLGVPTREFRVDDYGAPRYPELVLVTRSRSVLSGPETAAFLAATEQGYADTVTDPDAGLSALLAAVPELSEDEQRRQLEALLDAGALDGDLRFDRAALAAWARWDVEHGILASPPKLDRAFDL